MEYLVPITLFAGRSDDFKEARETSEMSHDLEHQKLS